MVGAGVAVLWLGYAVTYWGAGFLSGQTLGFLTVIWPERWHGTTAKPAAKKKA